MARDYMWTVAVRFVQQRSHGEDIPSEPVYSYIYEVESDHALSIVEGLERVVKQEREM